MNQKPICFIDLETTGTNISTDRICEIAIVITEDERNWPVKEYHRYINPGIPIPPEVSKVTGLTNDDPRIKNAKHFSDHAQEIFEFLSGCDLAGHRIMSFDLPLLVEEMLRSGINNFGIGPGIRYYDTYRIQAHLVPRTLKACYEQMTGKKFNDESAHSALYDTKATIELFDAQMERFDHGEVMNKELMSLITVPEDQKIIDFAGKLKLNDNDLVCYAFGKNIDKPVSSDRNYASWMLNNDFTKDTKRWITLALNNEDSYVKIMTNGNNKN